MSSYAETVMTYSGSDGQKTRIPRLSEEAKQGKSFPCIACGRTVRITTNSAWKRHLYSDLQPYMCLDTECNMSSFCNRNDWVSHLALEHYEPDWKSITCPLCFEVAEQGKVAITRHLASHLEEISLSALPSNPDEDVSGAGSDTKSLSDESRSSTAPVPLQSQHQQPTYESYATTFVPPVSIPAPIQHRPSSGMWAAADDQQLLAARMQGLNWLQIQSNYFPSKTPNACRKRHERLLERKITDNVNKAIGYGWQSNNLVIDKKLNDAAQDRLDILKDDVSVEDGREHPSSGRNIVHATKFSGQ